MAAEDSPLLAQMAGIPPAPFTGALPMSEEGSQRLPQAIAHRGYKVAYPENTMAAFRAAVAVGSHALETDLHLSGDGVVVLSHDATLERCFGKKEKVARCDWEYLSSLRTLRAPHEPMPRLVDLLTYLAQPGLEDIWLLLDVKIDNDADEILSRTAAAIASVPASRPWRERIVVGCWNAQYIQLSKEHLPGFPVAYIGWSLLYAIRILRREPNVNFNLIQQSLVGPCGTRFINAAQKAARKIFVWTVNEVEWMEWSIRKGVDGVITDDPKLFLEVCDRLKGGSGSDEEGPSGKAGGGTVHPSAQRRLRRVRQFAFVVFVQIFATLLTPLLFFLSGGMAAKRRRRR